MTYVAVNLLVGTGVAVIAIRYLRATSEEVGMTGNRLRIAVAAGAGAILLTAPLFALALIESTAHWVADERIADLDGADIAFHALVRIPLGTALFEEFVFRGALFGLLSRRSVTFGAAVSSVAFGLWHIRPTADIVDANTADPSTVVMLTSVGGAVLLTTAAGFAFCWLRVKGGGIAAPVAFHAVLNSMSLIAAAIAHGQVG